MQHFIFPSSKVNPAIAVSLPPTGLRQFLTYSIQSDTMKAMKHYRFTLKKKKKDRLKSTLNPAGRSLWNVS